MFLLSTTSAYCHRTMTEIDAWSTGLFARPLALSLVRSLIRSFARIAHLLALHCSLRSRDPLRSLTRSRAYGKDIFVYELNASISYNFNSQCVVKDVRIDRKIEFGT